MKWILTVILFSTIAWAQPAKGPHDGIDVQITSAQMSANGKLVIIRASAGDAKFLLVCRRAAGSCSLPRLGASYRVISETDKGVETWGLVSGDQKILLFDLMAGDAQ
jgi:hypothetical protein